MYERTFKEHLKKKLVIFSIAVIMCLSVIPILPTASATIINVPGDYTTIQAAINAANPAGGDTIHVAAGIYSEQLTISKPLIINGDDGAILDGTGLVPTWTTGVKIKSGDVTFNNVDVTDFTQDGIIIGYEASIPGSLKNVHITNCKVANIQPGYWGFGIYAGYEGEAWNYDPPKLTAFLDYSGLLIENNEITNTACSGLVLQSITASSGNIEVRNNYFHDISTNDAIWIDGARTIVVEDNIIENNLWGIDLGCIGDDPDYSLHVLNGLYGPKDITIQGNDIINNVEESVCLIDGWPSTIFVNYNNINGNGIGIQNYLTDILDATCNWYGDLYGPTHSSNPAGAGDVVSDNIDFIPWLDDVYPAGDCVGEPVTCVDYVWVDDDAAPDWYDFAHVATMQMGVDHVCDGGTVTVYDGTYSPFKVESRNDILITRASNPIITGNQKVSDMSYTPPAKVNNIVFVNNSVNIDIIGFDIIGTNPGGRDFTIFYQRSSGSIQDCLVNPNNLKNMNALAIRAITSSDLAIENCVIQNYGRIAVYAKDDTMLNVFNSTLMGHTYTTADGDYVNYGIEVEGINNPCTGTIMGNEIYGHNYIGNPSWTSSGILVDSWRYYGPSYNCQPSTVTITQNNIHDNMYGLEIVANANIHANCNLIYDNTIYGAYCESYYDGTQYLKDTLDAECNWWGDFSGPNEEGPGTGDNVSTFVDYDPWVGKDIAEAGGPYTSLSTGCVTFAGSANLACCVDVITITDYSWDFGDGQTGTGAAPEHCYATPGTYTVTFTATFSMLGVPIGTDTDTAAVTVFTCPPDDGTPVIDLIAPEPNTQVGGVTKIEWRAYIPANEGSNDFYVDLYYGLDTLNWRLIDENLPNNDPNDPIHGYYMWNTDALADGDYYILAEVWTNDHSKMNYDIVKPTFYIYNGNLEAMVSDVLVIDVSTNSKQWIKDTDTVTVSAGITGASGISKNDIVADLTGLGGGTAVPADEFDGLNAIWHLDNVVCSPSNGPITITVTLLGEDSASNTCIIVADNIRPEASLVKPVNGLYLFGAKILPLKKTMIIGSATVQLSAQDATSGVQKVELYLNGNLIGDTQNAPYIIALNKRNMGPAQLRIDVYDNAGNIDSISQLATIYNLLGN